MLSFRNRELSKVPLSMGAPGIAAALHLGIAPRVSLVRSQESQLPELEGKERRLCRHDLLHRPGVCVRGQVLERQPAEEQLSAP